VPGLCNSLHKQYRDLAQGTMFSPRGLPVSGSRGGRTSRTLPPEKITPSFQGLPSEDSKAQGRDYARF